MIRKHQRLSRDSRFREVHQQGQSWAHPLMVLRALRNDLSHSRFGFVVGKRIGNAVQRNRVKRLMREAMRASMAQIPPGMDVVLIARGPIVGAPLSRVSAALQSLLPHLSEALDSRVATRSKPLGPTA